MSARTSIDQTALDATIAISKKVGIRRNKSTQQMLAGVQIIIANAICECLPTNDRRLKDRL